MEVVGPLEVECWVAALVEEMAETAGRAAEPEAARAGAARVGMVEEMAAEEMAEGATAEEMKAR